MCSWRFFDKYPRHPIFFFRWQRRHGMDCLTGVVHEDPIDRISRGSGTNAAVRVAEVRNKSAERRCMIKIYVYDILEIKQYIGL